MNLPKRPIPFWVYLCNGIFCVCFLVPTGNWFQHLMWMDAQVPYIKWHSSLACRAGECLLGKLRQEASLIFVWKNYLFVCLFKQEYLQITHIHLPYPTSSGCHSNVQYNVKGHWDLFGRISHKKKNLCAFSTDAIPSQIFFSEIVWNQGSRTHVEGCLHSYEN